MIPFFTSDEAKTRMAAEARTWLFTPYAADGAVKGTGCSCAMLPYAVLHAEGHPANEPPSRRGLKKKELLPTMRAWLDSATDHFERISDYDTITAGDIILVDAGIGHVALALSEDTLIHTWQTGGVQEISRNDPSLKDRIVGVWRPV